MIISKIYNIGMSLKRMKCPILVKDNGFELYRIDISGKFEYMEEGFFISDKYIGEQVKNIKMSEWCEYQGNVVGEENWGYFLVIDEYLFGYSGEKLLKLADKKMNEYEINYKELLIKNLLE